MLFFLKKDLQNDLQTTYNIITNNTMTINESNVLSLIIQIK
jgi:hypothetical protein